MHVNPRGPLPPYLPHTIHSGPGFALVCHRSRADIAYLQPNALDHNWNLKSSHSSCPHPSHTPRTWLASSPGHQATHDRGATHGRGKCCRSRRGLKLRCSAGTKENMWPGRAFSHHQGACHQSECRITNNSIHVLPPPQSTHVIVLSIDVLRNVDEAPRAVGQRQL